MAFALFLTFFLLSIGAQTFFPHVLSRQRLLQNLKTNLSLGLFSYLTVGYLGKQGLFFLVTKLPLSQSGLLNRVGFTPIAKLLLGILILDLTAYLWHIANHRIQFLWSFHLVHHTDQVFDSSTALRFHPGEVLISLIVRAAVITVFGISFEALAVFESIYLFFNLFEHSNVMIPAWLRSLLHPLFITSALHMVHHTPNVSEQNSNFGTIFSIWDRLFGTLRELEAGLLVQFGVIEYRDDLNFKKLLLLPFKKR